MKKGEGSRGGHVIGHTKSGKPIYGSPADRDTKVKKALRIGKALGVATAGAGVSAASGMAAAALDARHHKLRSFAMSAGKRAGRHWDSERSIAALAATEKSEKLFERSARAGSLATKVHGIGITAGAALLALGANEILKETSLSDQPEARSAVSTGAGAAAAFTVQNVYLTSLFDDSKPVQAIKKVAGLAIKKAIRRV